MASKVIEPTTMTTSGPSPGLSIMSEAVTDEKSHRIDSTNSLRTASLSRHSSLTSSTLKHDEKHLQSAQLQPPPSRRPDKEQDITSSGQHESKVKVNDEVGGDQGDEEEEYTTFSASTKTYLTYLLGVIIILSTLTATIYFPLIPMLSQSFSVSVQAINLTVTIYAICQAISPALFASLADASGRRPVLLGLIVIYCLASLGLALNKGDYGALIALRALQSIGGSATPPIAYGIVADVAVVSERGAMLGPMLSTCNAISAVGPVIGGAVALSTDGYRWVFLALLMIALLCLLLAGFTLPETSRNVVGNGSRPAGGVWRTWWSFIKPKGGSKGGGGKTWKMKMRKRGMEQKTNQAGEKDGTVSSISESPPPTSNASSEMEPLPSSECPSPRVTAAKSLIETTTNTNNTTTKHPPRPKWRPLNAFASLRIVLYPDAALVLWMISTSYIVYYTFQVAIPVIYADVYGYNELEIGLTFLPGLAGMTIGGIVAGKLVDRNYALTARKYNIEIYAEEAVVDVETKGMKTRKKTKTKKKPKKKLSPETHLTFPLEEARYHHILFFVALQTCLVSSYGWTISFHLHPAIPLILQFFICGLSTLQSHTASALLVDIFPETASSAYASGQIVRCGMSAASAAVIQPLTEKLGRGWYFVAFAAFTGLSAWAVTVGSQRKGKAWRMKRLKKGNR